LSRQLFHFAWLWTEDGCSKFHLRFRVFRAASCEFDQCRVVQGGVWFGFASTFFISVSLIHLFCTKGLWDVADVLWWPKNHSVTWFNPGLGFLKVIYSFNLQRPSRYLMCCIGVGVIW
ncbi:Uncharacterized protein APZ42_003839, partial [Daphnia magna]